MPRVLTVSDGFTSASPPTGGSLNLTGIAVYASTAAYVTAKGSAAANGDAFINSADSRIYHYVGGAWESSVRTSVFDALLTGIATTKGDILARDASDVVRLGVGSNDQVLTADSAEDTGLKWATPASALTTTKGDILARDASDVVRLPVGTNGQVLQADSSEDTGLIWATPASALTSPLGASNYSVAISSSSGALTIALKDAAGSDPTGGSPASFAFRSSTLATAGYSSLSRDSALSLVISSGSTLGFASARAGEVYVGVMDVDGTEANMQLIVARTKRDETVLQSCTAEGGAGGADSVSAIYGAGAQTTKPIKWIARFTFTLTTAGTWVAAEASQGTLLPFSGRPEVAIVSGDAPAATSTNPIIWPSIQYSYTNGYNTATGRYTCAQDGIYRISCAMISSNNNVTFFSYRNGADLDYMGATTDSGEGYLSCLKRCSAGDLIDIRPDGATVDASSGSVRASFEYVGPSI